MTNAQFFQQNCVLKMYSVLGSLLNSQFDNRVIFIKISKQSMPHFDYNFVATYPRIGIGRDNMF